MGFELTGWDSISAKTQIWDLNPLSFFFLNLLLLLLVWPCCAAFGILVPRPGIEPGLPTVEARSLNHWTAGEFLNLLSFN